MGNPVKLLESNQNQALADGIMITLRDIEDARKAIQREINKTPLVHSEFLSGLCGGEVYLKLENLQITNSFKIRGALNRMMHLRPDEIGRGVITASLGNHAQAVAIGAEKLNVTGTVVVPETTSRIKIEKIRKHKVELILHGETYDLAEQYAQELAKKGGLIFISPYNDSYVVAGQGTVGLEILEDLPTVDTIIVPVSGGSLLAGIGVAAKSTRPNIEILGVQPETTPAMYYSFKAGKITDVEMKDTIADCLSGNIEHGSITFEIIQSYVDEIMLFDEETIKKAIRLLWDKEKQITEGSGAISIAPIMKSTERFARKRTVAVISGGNIDEAVFQNILASEAL
jgi:threonine dehydratase